MSIPLLNSHSLTNTKTNISYILDAYSPLSPALKPIPELRALENKFKSVDGDAAEYEKKSKVVYEYLVDVFESADKQSDGSLPAAQFWNAVYDLPLSELGFTQGELDAIRQYSSWENDGVVYYYEVLFELGDSVIASIEGKRSGEKDVFAVLSKLKEQGVHHETHHMITPAVRSSSKFFTAKAGGRLNLAEASIRKGSVYQYPNIPIFFRQYLIDTLTAFDLDCNGYLTEKELATLLEVLNVPELTMRNFMEEGIDSISPKEASDAILNVVDPYFTDGTEHYVSNTRPFHRLIDVRSHPSYFSCFRYVWLIATVAHTFGTTRSMDRRSGQTPRMPPTSPPQSSPLHQLRKKAKAKKVMPNLLVPMILRR